MGCRIDAVEMKNFGAVRAFSGDALANINLIIGENGTGKTTFLKGVYAAVRTLEEYQQGEDSRTLSEVQTEKLRQIFQMETLGGLVAEGAEDRLSMCLQMGERTARYQVLGNEEDRAEAAVSGLGTGQVGKCVYIPAQEALSLWPVLRKAQRGDRYEIDGTYLDLMGDLLCAPVPEGERTAISKAREIAAELMDGKMDYDGLAGKWTYTDRNGLKFPAGIAPESAKKAAILDRLLANGGLKEDGILLLDGIEEGLHPVAICRFVDLLGEIANGAGVQVFIASHSYFVLKKLGLMAMGRPGTVSCILLEQGNPGRIVDLSDGLPQKSIIDTSIRLYEEEIELVL